MAKTPQQRALQAALLHTQLLLLPAHKFQHAQVSIASHGNMDRSAPPTRSRKTLARSKAQPLEKQKSSGFRKLFSLRQVCESEDEGESSMV